MGTVALLGTAVTAAQVEAEDRDVASMTHHAALVRSTASAVFARLTYRAGAGTETSVAGASDVSARLSVLAVSSATFPTSPGSVWAGGAVVLPAREAASSALGETAKLAVLTSPR